MSDMPHDPNPYESPPPVPGEFSTLSKDVRNWAMFCHLASLIGYLALPVLGNIIGPLVVWLLKKEEHPFIDEQGKESLNFQISIIIYTLLLTPSICIGIGVFILPAIWILGLVLSILAAIKASNGEDYRYPLTIRLVK